MIGDVGLIVGGCAAALLSSLRFVSLYRGRMIDFRIRSRGVRLHVAVGSISCIVALVGEMNLIEVHQVNLWLSVLPACVIGGWCYGLPIGFHNHQLRRAARTVTTAGQAT